MQNAKCKKKKQNKQNYSDSKERNVKCQCEGEGGGVYNKQGSYRVAVRLPIIGMHPPMSTGCFITVKNTQTEHFHYRKWPVLVRRQNYFRVSL